MMLYMKKLRKFMVYDNDFRLYINQSAFFIRYKLRLKNHLNIKYGRMETSRTSTFAKSCSFKCHC
jgi:hypothetical protein